MGAKLGPARKQASLCSMQGSGIVFDCVALGGPGGRFAVVPLANFSLGLFSVEKACLLQIGTCRGHHRRVTALAVAATISVVASGGASLGERLSASRHKRSRPDQCQYSDMQEAET